MKVTQVMALAVNMHNTKKHRSNKNTNTKMLKTDDQEYERVKKFK